MRLYDTDHPYYCVTHNHYVANPEGWGAPMQFDSIKEYLEEFGDADLDMNFIFRWDWVKIDPDDYSEGEDVPPDEVRIFYFMQRKGTHKVITIENPKKEHEPLLRAHLKKHWDHMVLTWEGVS